MPKEARKKAEAELKNCADVAHVGRSHRGAQLHRVVWSICLGRKNPVSTT